MENLNRIIQNKMLVKSCKRGDAAGVRKALKRGADPNTMVPVGTRYEGMSRHEIDWKERTYVHPVILAAKSALHGNKISYQKIIYLLINHPKTNLSPVVRHYEWDVEGALSDSIEPDIKRYYNKGIQDVLNLVLATDQSLSARLNAEQKRYGMSVPMANYIKQVLENKEKTREKKKGENVAGDLILRERAEQKIRE